MSEEKPAPKKRGRKPILDPEQVAAALVALRGNIAGVAKQFAVHRSSVQEFIEKRPTLRKILSDAREGMLDNAESALYTAVLAGQAWAVCFFLKTQGRSRGYIEKQEIEHKGEAKLIIKRVVVDGGNTQPRGELPPGSE